MPRFQFRLAALQTYRESLRDQCRQVLAQWLQRDAALVDELQRLDTEREQQLEEIRGEQMGTARMGIDRMSARRYRAGQLTAEMQGVQEQRQTIAVQISLCRQALVKADQGVKILEQLAEAQFAEYRQDQEKRESREREEIWQAGRGRET